MLTPTAPNVERFRAAGLTVTVIPGAEHSPMVETPGAFVNAVTEFFR